ncbi:hypothetical protein GLW03_13255 [Halobacillus halophilus]|uniref:EpsG family protein n=1 Tax=Halobacillus halophilus TaxID=1570 RepID=UPI00136E196B|nr:EpsG family protein [Halobacillus halophilus]MYL30778.1 hypothetical protein [Halobacillus halophilus]
MRDFTSLLLYLCVFIISALLISIGKKQNKKSFSPLTIIGLSLPILMAAFRYGVGTDYFNYMREFNQSKNVSILNYLQSNGVLEIGSFLINKLSVSINSYSFLLGIYSGLTLIAVYLSILEYKSKVPIGLSFFVFLCIYYPFSLNLMSQFLAIAIVAISFKYIFEKNVVKFITLTFIASLFHSTSLIMLPIYFFWNKKQDGLVNKWKIIIVIIISMFFAYNYQIVLESISQLKMFEQYDVYVDANKIGQNRDIFIKLILFVFVFLFRKQLISYDQRNKLYILLLLLNLIIGLTGFTSPWVKRVTLYFEIAQIFILPSIIYIFYPLKDRVIVMFGISIYAMSYFVLVYYLLKQANVIPYRLMF